MIFRRARLPLFATDPSAVPQQLAARSNQNFMQQASNRRPNVLFSGVVNLARLLHLRLEVKSKHLNVGSIWDLANG